MAPSSSNRDWRESGDAFLTFDHDARGFFHGSPLQTSDKQRCRRHPKNPPPKLVYNSQSRPIRSPFGPSTDGPCCGSQRTPISGNVTLRILSAFLFLLGVTVLARAIDAPVGVPPVPVFDPYRFGAKRDSASNDQ